MIGAPVRHVRSTQQQCKMTHDVNVRTKHTWRFSFLQRKAPVRQIQKLLRSVHSDYCTRSVVLRAVRRALVTGPATADERRQRRRRSKTRLMCWFGTTEVNCAPPEGLKTGSYQHHQRTWQKKSTRKVGAKNPHRRKQKSERNIHTEPIRSSEAKTLLSIITRDGT